MHAHENAAFIGVFRSTATTSQRHTLYTALITRILCTTCRKSPMTASDPDLSGSRVLIADDNEQNRELLDAYLANEGYES